MNESNSAAPAVSTLPATELSGITCWVLDGDGALCQALARTADIKDPENAFVRLSAVLTLLGGQQHQQAAQSKCFTCSGHGLIGGLMPGDGGYHSEDCPDCDATGNAQAALSDVDELAQFIRYTDGDHTMGAGALAEKICGWLGTRQPAPVASAPAVAVPEGWQLVPKEPTEDMLFAPRFLSRPWASECYAAMLAAAQQPAAAPVAAAVALAGWIDLKTARPEENQIVTAWVTAPTDLKSDTNGWPCLCSFENGIFRDMNGGPRNSTTHWKPWPDSVGDSDAAPPPADAAPVDAKPEEIEPSALEQKLTERASWTFKQWYEHVGAWENDKGEICFGTVMALRAMLVQFQTVTQFAFEKRIALDAPPAPHVERDAALPPAVVAWYVAEKARIEAVGKYNGKLTAAKEHGFPGPDVSAEFKVMTDTGNAAHWLLRPMYEAIAAMTAQQSEKGGA